MIEVRGLYKTTFTVWTGYPLDGMSITTLARQATDGDAYSPAEQTVLIPCPDADPDWDGTDFFDPHGKITVRLLCDRCYEALTGGIAGCQPGCRHDGLDADGACLWPEGPTECQWCTHTDRLTPVPADHHGFHNLPTVEERDEGQWWLDWIDEQQGPYASEAAAWDAWRSNAN